MNQSLFLSNHAVAVFNTHESAEHAVRQLDSAGYDMRNLSIVGQDYQTEERPLGFINAKDRMLSWGKFGAFWGTIWGLLFGSAMFVVPGLGYVLFAGWIVSALEGAVIGGGIAALGGALASIGIPNDSVVNYETMIKSGSFLVIAHGSAEEVKHAKDVLEETSATQVNSYSTQKSLVAAG